MTKTHITKIENNGHFCPSQWDLWDDDGKEYYARYRWGGFTLQDWTNKNDILTLLEYRLTGHSFDGIMSTKRMMEICRDLFDFTGCEIIDEEEREVLESEILDGAT